jgi:protein O-GlcNAc transferase
VSYDFADHPLAHLLNSLFRLHDRSCFEVIGFSLRPNDNSIWRNNIAKTCDEFYQIEEGVSAFELANLINQKNIHILFNLNGWTAGAR